MNKMASRQKLVTFLLFPGYELLDVFGPMELFAAASRVIGKETEGYTIDVVGEPKGSLTSNGGPACVYATHNVDEYLSKLASKRIDLLVVPGGAGCRTLVNDNTFLSKMSRLCDKADIISSICTGSAMLAKAGLLDGRKATSNKFSFSWVVSQSSKVHWQPKARWVVDGRYWTSSGVAAGMDMALALIAQDFGLEIAEGIAKRVEYVWNKDPHHDLFEAKL